MKTIVIVGGGYGGNTLAQALEKQHGDSVRIILIDSKPYFYHAVGGLRGAVQDLDEALFIPYSKLFASSQHKVVHATVVRFDENVVYLNSGNPDQIAFDFLVIASGSSYSAPARIAAPELDQGKQQLQQIRQQIHKAKHILIVGGGPVGIELAGEIQDLGKQAPQLSLIHNQSQLGHPSYMPLKAHRKVLGLMKSKGIQVLLNDKVDLPPSSAGTMMIVPETPLKNTQKGQDLSSVDLVLVATGNRPHPDWIKASFPDLVQSSGYVKVQSTLQVDHPTLSRKVFVIGDAADLDESKLAFRAAQGHAPIVAANLATLLKQSDSPSSALKHYKKGMDVMLITFGKSDGITVLPWGIILGGWFSSMVKSKTLFIDRYWKELNQPVPSVLK